ncbi:MAG: hypothetical protein M3Y84_10270 [Acidobacteriota bacterium]|nr:hypothetical protein [Acidobacteriota bacterium]
MKTGIQGFILTLLLAATASAAKATISHFTDDGICSPSCSAQSPYPVLRGHNVTITLVGQYIDSSTSVEVPGSGLYVNNVGTASGSRTVQLEVLDSASGTYTIKFHYVVELSGPDTFKVVVLQNGSVSNVNVPTPTKPFNDLDFTVTGTNIDNASVFCGSPVADCSLGATSVSLTQNTATQAKIRAHFLGPLVRVSGAIRLGDKAGGDACQKDARYCYKQSGGSADIHVSAVAPNFVDTAGLDNAYYARPKEGEVLTFHVRLMEAAKSGGEKVFWQLTPSGSFGAVSGTNFSPTGVNSVTVPAGRTSQTLTVIFKKAPEGCPTQGCPAQIQARIEPQPEFVVGEFKLTPVPLIPLLIQPHDPIRPR